MKLIIGLGNPGENFDRTVHNIGFAIIDKIRETFNFKELKNQEEAAAWTGDHLGRKIILLKPQTFMNESGRCVLSFIRQLNLKTEDILVLQDDVTLLPGKIRFKRKSSSGGHNGVKDIINQLGNNHFARIKIGVGDDKTTTLDKWVTRKLGNGRWEEIISSVEVSVLEIVTK